MPFDPNDPDTKAAIDKIKAEFAASEDGLKAKNTELMDEVKQIKADLRKAKDIDPADVAKLEEQVDKLKSDLAAAQKEAKDSTAAKEKAEKALESETGFNSRLLIDNGLTTALNEAGVKEPELLKAVKAMMAGGASIAKEGEERVVKFGDKALADHVKEWAGTDGAKHFISAANNGGGGSGGDRGGQGGGKTITKAEYQSTLNSGDIKAIGAMNEGIRKGETKVVDAAA